MSCCCGLGGVLRPGHVFGASCAYHETSDLLVTSSTTPQLKLSTTTPVLPAGKYYVSATGYVSTTSSSTTQDRAELTLLVDAVNVHSTRIQTGSGVAYGSERVLWRGSRVVTFATQIAHTVSVTLNVFASSSTGQQVSATWTQLELWRFSP